MTELSKTVDKMTLILRTLGDGRTASAREIAADLGMNRTVVQRLLTTLHAQDFVARLGADGYALSFRVQALSERILPELRQAARPVAHQLAAALGATVTLHVADGAEAVVAAEQLPAGAPVQVRHVTGSRSPLTRGAGPKALLAFAEPTTARRLGPETDPVLADELAEVRRTGFATSREEIQRGAQAIATPVRDAAGVVVASVAVLVPDEDDALDAMRAPLAKAAQEIEHRLRRLATSSRTD